MSEVQIWCESCDMATPLHIDPMESDDLNGDSVWGDLCCSRCHLVIATLTVPERGIYEFTKVGEIPVSPPVSPAPTTGEARDTKA